MLVRSYTSETSESDWFGSQDYTRLGLDLNTLLPSAQSQSTQYECQDWADIDWDNVPEMSSSPVKDPEHAYDNDSDDDHVSEEGSEEPFVPFTQTGPPIRPITRGFSFDSESQGFQLDDAAMELLDQLEREIQEAEPTTRVSPLEDISSFTSTPRGSATRPESSHHDHSPISSFSSQRQERSTSAPRGSSSSFSVGSRELDLGHLDSQTVEILQGLEKESRRQASQSSYAAGSKDLNLDHLDTPTMQSIERIESTAQRATPLTQAGSKEVTPVPTQEARPLGRRDTYSFVDFGHAALDLNNLTQSVVQSMDAIEASFPANKRPANKKKRKAVEPISDHQDSTQSQADSDRMTKKRRQTLTRKSSLINVTSVAAESRTLECCFCMKLLVRPQVSSTCGHTLGCESCTTAWLAKHSSQPTCYHPNCHSIITSLTPNHTLIQVVSKHVKLLHHLYAEWDENHGEMRRDFNERQSATL